MVAKCMLGPLLCTSTLLDRVSMQSLRLNTPIPSLFWLLYCVFQWSIPEADHWVYWPLLHQASCMDLVTAGLFSANGFNVFECPQRWHLLTHELKDALSIVLLLWIFEVTDGAKPANSFDVNDLTWLGSSEDRNICPCGNSSCYVSVPLYVREEASYPLRTNIRWYHVRIQSEVGIR